MLSALLWALVVWLAPKLSRRAGLLWSVVGLHVVFLLAPPLLSQDVFSYIAYARLGVEHGLNPYAFRPFDIPARSRLPLRRIKGRGRRLRTVLHAVHLSAGVGLGAGRLLGLEGDRWPPRASGWCCSSTRSPSAVGADSAARDRDRRTLARDARARRRRRAQRGADDADRLRAASRSRPRRETARRDAGGGFISALGDRREGLGRGAAAVHARRGARKVAMFAGDGRRGGR